MNVDYISDYESESDCDSDCDSNYTWETISDCGSLELSDCEESDYKDLKKGHKEYEKYKHTLDDFIEDDLLEDDIAKDLIQTIVEELSKGLLSKKRKCIEWNE